ncbi:MAG: hypothetical protein ABIJ00_14310 [Candidatus Eisenbacteria bacterium]
MSTHIGAGYGSEFHLMRWMGRYRNELNTMIEQETGGQVIEWKDFKHSGKYDPADATKIKLPDKEITGIDFLSQERCADVFTAWKSFWPQTGNAPNWDAVGRIRSDSVDRWLLVEAKAHIGELKSRCSAESPRSLETIEKALHQTQQAVGIEVPRDWLKEYYQYANRLAVLHFLEYQGVPACLLYIYFCGDTNPHADCPKERDGWKEALEMQDSVLGLDSAKKKKFRIHTIYVGVTP